MYNPVDGTSWSQRSQRSTHIVSALLLGALAASLLCWRHSLMVVPKPEYASDSESVVTEKLKGARWGEKTVLVTGAAGFVGFHTSLQLRAESETVVGIDSFNTYYDVSLKRNRAKLLAKAGVRLIEGNVCDGKLLRRILYDAEVTNVIHLAAQAGVRYSLTHPLEYIEANVKCFVTLLEAVHEVNYEIPIVYASSSSIYGLNKLTPFSEKHQADSQASLYGATKKANENIAHVYHHLHQLKLTGLRFFTVYGPYGRPDMAYFSFTRAILEGRTITEFRNQDGTELQRDFTYVSDIVSGVVAAMRLEAPLEIFNLGNTHPESVAKLVSTLERGLGRSANKTLAPIAAGDVPITYSDVTHAQKRLGYSPKVSLEEGIHKFLMWYSDYYHVQLAVNALDGEKSDVKPASAPVKAAQERVRVHKDAHKGAHNDAHTDAHTDAHKDRSKYITPIVRRIRRLKGRET